MEDFNKKRDNLNQSYININSSISENKKVYDSSLVQTHSKYCFVFLNLILILIQAHQQIQKKLQLKIILIILKELWKKLVLII